MISETSREHSGNTFPDVSLQQRIGWAAACRHILSDTRGIAYVLHVAASVNSHEAPSPDRNLDIDSLRRGASVVRAASAAFLDISGRSKPGRSAQDKLQVRIVSGEDAAAMQQRAFQHGAAGKLRPPEEAVFTSPDAASLWADLHEQCQDPQSPHATLFPRLYYAYNLGAIHPDETTGADLLLPSPAMARFTEAQLDILGQHQQAVATQLYAQETASQAVSGGALQETYRTAHSTVLEVTATNIERMMTRLRSNSPAAAAAQDVRSSKVDGEQPYTAEEAISDLKAKLETLLGRENAA